MRFDKRLPVAIVTAAGLVLGAVAPGSVMEANAASAKTRVGSSAAGQRVKLGLNKSIVLDLPSDAYDILVANPAVAMKELNWRPQYDDLAFIVRTALDWEEHLGRRNQV